MKKRDIGILGIVALLFLNFKFNSKQPKHEEYLDDEVQEAPKKRVRVPASAKQNPLPKTEIFRPQVSRSIREHHSNYNPPVEKPEIIGGGISGTPDSRFYISGGNGHDRSWGGSDIGENTSDRSVANSDKESSTSILSSGILTTTSPAPTYSSGGSSGSSSDALSCSSSLGGGAYGNPIEIALTCTAPSEIRYCVSVGSCCDPLTSGIVYSSKIVIGENEGDYCLSFYGEGTSNSESAVVQRNYNIDLTLPSLEVTHPKRYYQTTELSGISHVASDMFGRPNFGVGAINLASNDPGPSGLNLGCEEIITNYVSFPAPAPKLILGFFDTAGISPVDQLNVPLQLDQLYYGDNFITSYIADNNFAASLYSCSTTKVRLEDFDYFQADASHAVAGTNEVREFAGGFSGYGFFEEEINVYRGPAGASVASYQGETLETGLFSVFY